MNKRHLHHLWTQLRAVRPWYFLVLALLSGMIFIFALRHNYEHMSQLRSVVYTADKNGGDVQGALKNLQNYVVAHMNTGLSTGNTAIYPPIQLKYTYERLTQASTQSATTNNQQLYSDAQAYCQRQNSTDFSGRTRIPCIAQYVMDHGVKVQPVPDSLYKFDFVSPYWSPDLAGWSLVATFLFLVLFAGFWAIERWIRQQVD
jgi:preprotein translocase subunit SecF